MPPTTSAVWRQATRVCGRRMPARSTWSAPRSFAGVSARTYVTETRPGQAQVNVETAIKESQKSFMQKAATAPGSVTLPGVMDSADAANPAASTLTNASIMDQGSRPIYLDMQVRLLSYRSARLLLLINHVGNNTS